MAKDSWTPPGNRSNQHIDRWRSLLYPKSTAAGRVIRETVARAKAKPKRILKRYTVGQKVRFERFIHYYVGSGYETGVITASHVIKRTAHYTIKTADNTFHDVADYRVFQVLSVALAIYEPCTAIVLYEPLELGKTA